MKRNLSYILGLILLGMAGIASGPADSATTAAGPYYATPSWDQTLPSATRFIILSNFASAAVLDRETGLVWERSPLSPCLAIFCIVPETGTRNWAAASFHCTDEVTVGSRRGWRLPTLQELASLVDADPANTSSPRLPPGHPFIGVQPSFYWSATAIANPFPSAWGVTFDSGHVGGDTKGTSASVWCVRGGQGVDVQ